MNGHAPVNAFGATLTESEMADVVGGTSTILYAIGFVVGAVSAMVVRTALAPEMQQYCFGA